MDPADGAVLVTGASGLLGGRLAQRLHAGGWPVLAARHRAAVPPDLAAVDLDLERVEPDALQRLLDAHDVRGLVHAAALAQPDACEAEPERARRLNTEVPRRLARACRAAGIRLVALSTDLVFDGTRAGWREDDPPLPLMAYGRTKLDGEKAVLDEHPAAAVARIALVVGRGFGPRASGSEAIAWALRAQRPMRLFVDEHRTPVDADSVADGVRRLLAGEGCGLFHFGGPERLSRHALGLRVATALGLPADGIQPARQAEHRGGAPRAADVSLDSTRARRELGWVPRPLDQGLREGRPGPDAA